MTLSKLVPSSILAVAFLVAPHLAPAHGHTLAIPPGLAWLAPPSGPTRFTFLADGSADGSGSPVRMVDYETVTFYLQGTGTLNAGNVYIEESDWDAGGASNYSGTWSIMSTTAAASITGGTQIAVAQSSIRAYSFVRARRASVGGGGTVRVTGIAF